MSLSKAAVATSLIVVLLAISSARASVVVSNLGEPLQVDFAADGTHFATAGSFTTSAAGTYKLNSVDVNMNFNASSGVTTGLRLRADNGGTPGTLIENLGSQTGGPGQQILTYSSVGSILSPNTTYWVTLGETGSGAGQQWQGTDSTAESSPISWTIGDQTFDMAIGSGTWNQVNFGPPNSAPLFAVDASPVPEPSAVWLAIAGSCCALLVTRFRRRYATATACHRS